MIFGIHVSLTRGPCGHRTHMSVGHPAKDLNILSKSIFELAENVKSSMIIIIIREEAKTITNFGKAVVAYGSPNFKYSFCLPL